MAVGTAVTGPLAFVDDITSMNTNIKDAVNSNEKICFFSNRKKQPLNESKCYLLPVNTKPVDGIPIQYVNGQRVTVVSEAKCLGDIFNSKGDMNDLVRDRVRKGTVCVVNAIALCPNQSVGKFAINSLLTLYKAVFLRTVLDNSETWCYLSEKNIQKLSSIQMKYIKRMLHCPRGTSNAFLLLELGILPVEEEIALRHFTFLHHILCLPDNDMVKIVFEQQALYVCEKNWRNHITLLLLKYKLLQDFSAISKMSKNEWKTKVTKAVSKYALTALNLKCFTQSKTAYLCPYKDLVKQPYIDSLHPNDARMWLQLRGGIYDLKSDCPFIYEDLVCRGCGGGVEDFEHVANHCSDIPRTRDSINKVVLDELSIKEGLARFRFFHSLIEEE